MGLFVWSSLITISIFLLRILITLGIAQFLLNEVRFKTFELSSKYGQGKGKREMHQASHDKDKEQEESFFHCEMLGTEKNTLQNHHL